MGTGNEGGQTKGRGWFFSINTETTNGLSSGSLPTPSPGQPLRGPPRDVEGVYAHSFIRSINTWCPEPPRVR